MTTEYEVVITGRNIDYQKQVIPDSPACLGKASIACHHHLGDTHELRATQCRTYIIHAAWETGMVTTLTVRSTGMALAGSAVTVEGPGLQGGS